VEEFGAVSMGIVNALGRETRRDESPPTGVEQAALLMDGIPLELREACEVELKAVAVAVAVLIHCGSGAKESVIEGLKQRKLFSQAFLDYMTEVVFPKLGKVSIQESMTLLTLACATIRNSEADQRKKLVQHAHAIVTSDSKTSLTEMCLFLVLCSHVLDTPELRALGAQGKVDGNSDVISLLAFVGHIGGEGDVGQAQKAFDRALTTLRWKPVEIPEVKKIPADALLRAIGHVRASKVEIRKTIIQALTNSVTADGKILGSEREILRAICIALEFPVPLLSFS
jgi:uncharacterized tellurite resistance protein B-like protein